MLFVAKYFFQEFAGTTAMFQFREIESYYLEIEMCHFWEIEISHFGEITMLQFSGD